MYTSTRLIVHLSDLPSYGSYEGTLVNVHGRVEWSCGHVHNFQSTALECAEYQKMKILTGGRDN